MTKLFVACLALFSLTARADDGISARVNNWIVTQAKQIADARQGLEGDFAWKLNSEGMIYAGAFATAQKDLCTVSAYRSMETAERLEYTALLSCRNAASIEGDFVKVVGKFAL